MTLVDRCIAQLVHTLECAACSEPNDEDESSSDAYDVVQSLACMPSELRAQFLYELQMRWRCRMKLLKENDSDWWRHCCAPSDLERLLWSVLTPSNEPLALCVAAFPPWFLTHGAVKPKHKRSLWSVDFTGVEWLESPSDVVTSLAQFDLAQLQTLVLHNQDAVTDETLALVLDAAPALCTLDVSYCKQLSDAGVTRALLALHSTLTTFSCSGLRALTSADIEALEQCAQLQSLALAGCIGITHLPTLAPHVHLTHVDLQGLSSLSDWDFRCFLAPHWHTLQTLTLCETEITAASLVYLMMTQLLPLSLHSALQELDLSWCARCEDAELGAVFQHTPSLVVLRLRCLNVDDSVLIALGASVCCAQLRVLDLERCSALSDDGFAALVGPSGPRRLERINLSWTAISTLQLRALLLQSAATLTNVRLQGCRSIDESILRIFVEPIDYDETRAHVSQQQRLRWPRFKRFDCKWVNEIRDERFVEAAQHARHVTFVGYYGTKFKFR